MKSIAFLIGADGDTFIKPIIEYLRKQNYTCDIYFPSHPHGQKINWNIIGTQYDLIWCEWATELAYLASIQRSVQRKWNAKIAIRLHRYEAGLQFMSMIEWMNIDLVFMVGNPFVLDVAEYINPDIFSPHTVLEERRPFRIEWIPNSVDLNQIPFHEKHTDKIAFIANIRDVKNPLLMIECIRSMCESNPNISCHIAGKIQDYWIYENMLLKIKRYQLPIAIDGWQENIIPWLADKSFVICTSSIESQGMGNLTAMATGCIPLILEFPGAEYIYPPVCIYQFPDFRNLRINWTPDQSRQFVRERFSSDIILPKYLEILKSLGLG